MRHGCHEIAGLYEKKRNKTEVDSDRVGLVSDQLTNCPFVLNGTLKGSRETQRKKTRRNELRARLRENTMVIKERETTHWKLWEHGEELRELEWGWSAPEWPRRAGRLAGDSDAIVVRGRNGHHGVHTK